MKVYDSRGKRIDKFPTGQVVMTAGAADFFNNAGFERQLDILKRHVTGDWGEVCADDKLENDRALIEGNRLLSAYDVDGIRFWIITEWNRSVTTILLPEEY